MNFPSQEYILSLSIILLLNLSSALGPWRNNLFASGYCCTDFWGGYKAVGVTWSWKTSIQRSKPIWSWTFLNMIHSVQHCCHHGLLALSLLHNHFHERFLVYFPMNLSIPTLLSLHSPYQALLPHCSLVLEALYFKTKFIVFEEKTQHTQVSNQFNSCTLLSCTWYKPLPLFP